MPNIQEAKCFEFTVQIPPPLGAPRGRQNFVPLYIYLDLFLYTPL